MMKPTETIRCWPWNALDELVHRPGSQVPALDGLRAMAVLMVISYHWWLEWLHSARIDSAWISSLPLFYWGWTGVDLFFVLSGVLIGKQLWSELRRTGRIEIGRFILRRGLRIWPLYYATLVFLLVARSSKAPKWPDWVMLSNYFTTTYERSWSLAGEEQFYLLVPVFLLILRRFVPSRRWSIAIIGVIAFVAAWRAVTFRQIASQGLSPLQMSVAMYYPFHLHCEPLFFGLLLAWIAVHRPEWLKPPVSGMPAYRVIGVASLLAILGIALRTVSREVFAYVALGCVFSGAVAVALADRSWVTAVLRWRVWYLVARLSFGMYLNHLMLHGVTEWTILTLRRQFGNDSSVAFILGLVLVVVQSAMLAALTFVLIEQPGLALRDRWLVRRAAIPPVPTAQQVA